MAVDMDGIKIKVKADTSEAKTELEKLKKTGESLSSIGSSLTLGLTAPIVGLGTACLMSASDADEMESKFNTVFKDLASEADKWANTYSDAIGRSQYEIKEAISNQADLYQGMGFTADEAYELSKQVTTLGYDLASFNNVNDAQAVDAMTKALMGETESAKMLGVNLTDTIMETSEFTKATGKSWKELNMAEKAQARYKEAVKQSKNAIGDAERTADGFANQTKRLKGNLEEFAVEIGKAILPIANDVVTGLNEMLSAITDLVAENPKLVETIVALGSALAIIPPVLWGVGKAMMIFSAAPALFGGIAAAAGIAGIAFLGMNENGQQAMDNLIYKISDLCSNFVSKVQENAPLMVELGTQFLYKLIDGLVAGIPVLVEGAFTITKLLVNTFMQTAPELLMAGTDLLLNLIEGIMQAIPGLSNTILNLSLDMLSWFLSNLPSWIAAGMDVLTNLTQGLAQTIPIAIGAIYDTVTGMLNTMIERMPEFMQKGKETILKIIEGLKNQLPTMLDNMGQAIMRTLNVIAEKMPEFLQKGVQFITEMVKGIGQNLPAILGKMGELLGLLVAKIAEYLPQFLSKGVEIVVKLVAGLINSIPKLISAGVDLAKGILDGIGSMLSGFLSVGSKIVQNIKQGVLNAWGNFTGWLSSKIQSIPIIGSFFRSVDPPEDNPFPVDPNTPTPFNIAPVSITDTLEDSLNFDSKFKKFKRENKGVPGKEAEFVKENKVEVNVNISEFNNNKEQDVEDLAEELAFKIQQKLVFS